jgi:hypothetical protein
MASSATPDFFRFSTPMAKGSFSRGMTQKWNTKINPGGRRTLAQGSAKQARLPRRVRRRPAGDYQEAPQERPPQLAASFNRHRVGFPSPTASIPRPSCFRISAHAAASSLAAYCRVAAPLAPHRRHQRRPTMAWTTGVVLQLKSGRTSGSCKSEVTLLEPQCCGMALGRPPTCDHHFGVAAPRDNPKSRPQLTPELGPSFLARAGASGGRGRRNKRAGGRFSSRAIGAVATGGYRTQISPCSYGLDFLRIDNFARGVRIGLSIEVIFT